MGSKATSTKSFESVAETGVSSHVVAAAARARISLGRTTGGDFARSSSPAHMSRLTGNPRGATGEYSGAGPAIIGVIGGRRGRGSSFMTLDSTVGAVVRRLGESESEGDKHLSGASDKAACLHGSFECKKKVSTTKVVETRTVPLGSSPYQCFCYS